MCDSDAREALGSKKTRKEPQRISETTWKLVESAVCVGGLGFSECGRKFGVTPHAIMQRAKRHGWPMPSKIAKRVEALQKSVTERAVCERNRACNDKVVDTIAESWAERGEAHRAVAFNLAHSELKASYKRGLPIEDWSAAEKADRMARRAAGLDSEEGTRISIGMEMINQRLETIDLPATLD
jgi:hypothetical protein